MPDRFDLEQQMVECWKIIDDIKMFVDNDADAVELHSLAIYYNRKFEQLWDTFEDMVKDKRFK